MSDWPKEFTPRSMLFLVLQMKAYRIFLNNSQISIKNFMQKFFGEKIRS